MLRIPTLSLCLLAVTFSASGQCPVGESAMVLSVETDAWGYEVYWEVVDAGASCGNTTWAFGGNSSDVGCDGNGNANGSLTYPSNSITVEDSFCLPTDGSYDFIHIDDYGDGGTEFELKADGVPIALWSGTGDGNAWEFSPATSQFVDHDSPCGAAPIVVDGDSILVSTLDATVQFGEPSPQANPFGACGTQGWWCGSDGNAVRTVWLTFIAPSDAPVTINTCMDGTTMDTQLALYKAPDCGDFSSFELVGAQDDIPGGCGPGNGYASFLTSDCLEEGATYFIQLDGWGGSSGDAMVAVASNPNPSVSLLVYESDLDCPLSEEVVADGQILVALVGGGLDFNCSISGPAGELEGPYASGLLPGEYAIDVLTSCGTELTAVANITVPESFAFAFDSQAPSCPGAVDGSIDVDLTGGTAPYEWDWTGSAGFASADDDLIDLGEGWYELTITDAEGCGFDAAVQLLSQNSLAFDLGADTLLCPGDDLLLYGPPGLSYEWQNGSINQFLFIEADEWGTGTYPIYLIVSNDEGCEESDVMILTIGTCTNDIDQLGMSEAAFYPNPAQEWVQWDLPSNFLSGEVFDAHGRLMEKIVMPSGKLDVSNWSSGIYFVKLSHEGGRSESFKLQVAH